LSSLIFSRIERIYLQRERTRERELERKLEREIRRERYLYEKRNEREIDL
jgi:hypothetical protein